MKIYDENGIEFLTAPDLDAGWLEDIQRLTAHHDAVPDSAAEYGWRVLEGTGHLHPGGLRQWVETKPAVPEVPAWDEYEDCQVYHPYTAEELAAQTAPTAAERLEAQVMYTAMMTDTMLEVMLDV